MNMEKGLKKPKSVSKKLQEFINSIANIGDSTNPNDNGKVYYSKVDGAYLTRVGMENELNFLLKKGITEQIQDGYGESKTCCIGFNPIEQKWYGWSHRAIFGFGIGSECKKENGKLGIWVRYTYNETTPNVNMRGQTGEEFSKYPKKWGKGEWVAETIEDAKQMAIDFARSVS